MCPKSITGEGGLRSPRCRRPTDRPPMGVALAAHFSPAGWVSRLSSTSIPWAQGPWAHGPHRPMGSWDTGPWAQGSTVVVTIFCFKWVEMPSNRMKTDPERSVQAPGCISDHPRPEIPRKIRGNVTKGPIGPTGPCGALWALWGSVLVLSYFSAETRFCQNKIIKKSWDLGPNALRTGAALLAGKNRRRTREPL